MRALVPLLLLAALPALADNPPPDVFTGRYRAVGRDAGQPPALVDGDVRLEAEGQGVRVVTCAGTAGHLAYDSIFDTTNLLTGPIGSWDATCFYNNDGGNYFILNCGTEAGVRVTLWPDIDDFDQPLRCAPGEGTPVGQ